MINYPLKKVGWPIKELKWKFRQFVEWNVTIRLKTMAKESTASQLELLLSPGSKCRLLNALRSSRYQQINRVNEYCWKPYRNDPVRPSLRLFSSAQVQQVILPRHFKFPAITDRIIFTWNQWKTGRHKNRPDRWSYSQYKLGVVYSKIDKSFVVVVEIIHLKLRKIKAILTPTQRLYCNKQTVVYKKKFHNWSKCVHLFAVKGCRAEAYPHTERARASIELIEKQ